MKKLILTGIMSAVVALSINAQEDKMMFNHLSVGVDLGTTGIGISLATPVSNYAAIRAGFDFVPTIKVDKTANIYSRDGEKREPLKSDEEAKHPTIQGKTHLTTGHFLVDVYPFTKNALHFTAGAYFGTDEPVTMYNKKDGALKSVNIVNEAITADHPGMSPEELRRDHLACVRIGDKYYFPDDEGNMKASIKTNSFRPYIGIGYGRAVSEKKKISCQVDLGCMFWGKPKVEMMGNTLDDSEIKDSHDKVDGAFEALSKIVVYPVLSVRINGTIF